MLATRTFEWGRSIAIVAGMTVVIAATARVHASDEIRFSSAREAFEQGVGAYHAGQYGLAIPALKAAAKQRVFFAPFYLARIFASNHPIYGDHARAYRLFATIVEEYGHRIDPDDFRRAPTVAKSLTAMARYVQNGVPELGLEPDLKRAIELYRYAAQFFNEEDAQFELAKLQLVGEGLREDRRTALYWLQQLVRRGHSGAQAFFADLLWRGKYVDRNPGEALALITLARRNAPPHEAIWIDDIYQQIFCGLSRDTRKQALGYVAGWEDKFGRRKRGRPGSNGLRLQGPERTCANGEPVKSLENSTRTYSTDADRERPLPQGQLIEAGQVSSDDAAIQPDVTAPTEQHAEIQPPKPALAGAAITIERRSSEAGVELIIRATPR